MLGSGWNRVGSDSCGSWDSLGPVLDSRFAMLGSLLTLVVSCLDLVRISLPSVW